jgi:tRNA A-37 threonylcarbamoyl transferase component Bud32
MGAIYVVEQISTGKQRALKLMLPQLVADAALRRRFEQEARVGALIESEHVVEVVGAGVDAATNTPWIAMELLVGDDLSQVVAQRGSLGVPEVRLIFEQLCHAVGAAHRAGVVHRDLKPENIFLTRSRRAGGEFTVKVLDFGIAKIVAEAKTSRTAPVGSPMWMAPEQTDRSKVTPASDVWALGLVAFHLLSGRYFWTAANDEDTTVTQLLREILFEPIPPASARIAQLLIRVSLPPGFDEWFARCVAREPAERFQNADEAIAPLRAVLSGDGHAPLVAAGVRPLAQVATPPLPQSFLGTSGTMAPSASTAPRIPGQGRGRLVLIAIAGIAAIGCGVFFMMRSRSAQKLVVAPTATGSPAAPAPPKPEELAPVSTNEAIPLQAKAPASALHASAPAHASVALEAGNPIPASTTHAPAGLEAGGPPKAVAPCVSQEEVQKIVRLHQARLNRACFERNETDRSFVNVNATLTIGVDGAAETVTATGDDPAVSQCVETHLRGWHFPVEGCTEKISIPFRFPLR